MFKTYLNNAPDGPMRINSGVDDRPIDPDVALLARVSALGG